MSKKDVLKSLAPQGIDLNELLNELIEVQASQQISIVPPDTGIKLDGNNANNGKAYEKTRPHYNNSVKRHK